jgi:siroheme synthase
VQNGTTPAQRLLRGRLDGLAELLARHGVEAPAMIFVGETAALAAERPIESAGLPLEAGGARWIEIALAG